MKDMKLLWKSVAAVIAFIACFVLGGIKGIGGFVVGGVALAALWHQTLRDSPERAQALLEHWATKGEPVEQWLQDFKRKLASRGGQA